MKFQTMKSRGPIDCGACGIIASPRAGHLRSCPTAMPQLYAGYVVEELLPFLIKATGIAPAAAEKQVRALLRELSCFELRGLPALGAAPPLVAPPGREKSSGGVEQHGSQQGGQQVRGAFAEVQIAGNAQQQGRREAHEGEKLPGNHGRGRKQWRGAKIVD